jgi:hypothetical protein
MQSNSRSQPTPRVGNLNGRRRDVVPDTMGTSQPTSGVGRQNRRRRDIVPDTMGSGQPTPRMDTLNGRTRAAVPATRGSGSGTRRNEIGSSHSTPPNNQLSNQNSSPIAGCLQRPPKRPRRSTIQTNTYNEPEPEPDGQGHMEAVQLCDDSSDEYQASQHGDETEPDTEPDVEDLGSGDDTPSGRRRGSQAAEGQGSSRARAVRISTTSGSQEAALVRRTSSARVSIIPGRTYMPPTFMSSSVGRYSSPPGIPSSTSGVRSSSPPQGEPSTPRSGRVWHGTNSRRNTATGVEGEIVGVGKTLMLRYTLFVDPLANPVALTSEVHSIWSRAQDEFADAGNVEPSEKSLYLVSLGTHGKRQNVLTMQDTAKTHERAGAFRISYKK